MAKDAKLLVVDLVLPEQAIPSTPAVMSNLHMLVMLNGIERMEAEFRNLFSSAGFNLACMISRNEVISEMYVEIISGHQSGEVLTSLILKKSFLRLTPALVADQYNERYQKPFHLC